MAQKLMDVLQSSKAIDKSVPDAELLYYIDEAQSEICLYLRKKSPLAREFESKIVNLAALKFRRNRYETSLKSRSYTEGGVSESETYMSAEDYINAEKELLSSLNVYRGCRVVKL